jgi:hypothetical protein
MLPKIEEGRGKKGNEQGKREEVVAAGQCHHCSLFFPDFFFLCSTRTSKPGGWESSGVSRPDDD